MEFSGLAPKYGLRNAAMLVIGGLADCRLGGLDFLLLAFAYVYASVRFRKVFAKYLAGIAENDYICH